MPRFMGSCPVHNEEAYQYCSSCNTFLCNICLTAGSHSTPDVLESHTIVPLQEAYRTLLRSHSV